MEIEENTKPKLKRKAPIKKEKLTKEKPITKKIKTEPNEEKPKTLKRAVKTKIEPEDEKEAKKIKTESKIKIKTEDPKSETFETDFKYDLPLKLSTLKNIELPISKNLIRLFESGDTIPFIARYRKNVTGEMDAENLRDIKESYEELCACKKKAEKIIDVIQKSGQLNCEIVNSISKSSTSEELEFIYEPYKPIGKNKTLVGRAKELNLYEPAVAILNGKNEFKLEKFVNAKIEGLKTIKEVENGILNVISHEISINADTIEFLQKLRNDLKLTLESKLKSKTTEDPGKKYQLYYDFKIPITYLKPHQILALNRGEKQKILTLKIVVPTYAQNLYTKFCYGRFKPASGFSQLFKNAIEDSYKRRIQPLIVRKTKTSLNLKAEICAIQTFALNLKNLLLMKPVKGKVILSIDPGYKVGCKVAVIDKNGEVLDSDVIYVHNSKGDKSAKEKLKNLLVKFECSLIVLGNGTACRETELWLSELIKNNYFGSLSPKYTIVDECGASIYSCSPEAKKEFPNLDPLFISAVSLARRVQDPLSEMVKIEPQHLGVGMYQHDVNKKLLENTLNEIVSECVSFIGVDINTASQCLLRRVAGLTELRAKKLIEYRVTNGPFTNRDQIRKVKGIGEKSFEQCAGFLRVGPTNLENKENFYKSKNTNPLDCTIIHPESYDLTKRILKKFNFDLMDIGKMDFIEKFSKLVTNISWQKLADEFDSTESTIKLILEALQKPFDYDLRDENNLKPVFRSGVTSLNDLAINITLNGHVRNVTTFGAFVDIGVGINGLIHKNNMKGFDVQLGNKVAVKIINLDIERQRIGLEVVNIL